MAAKRLSSHWLGAAGSSGPNKRPKFSAPRPPSSNASDSAQFSSSPSTSSLINTHQPETTTHEKAKGTGHAMLSLLKGSMKFLRKGCEMFPPLEATVGTLLEALELIETTTQCNQELYEMASDLPQWSIVLSAYLSSSQPDRMSKWVEKLIKDLLEQAEYLRIQQQRGMLKKLVESEQQVEELSRCYRRIETSFRHLQMDANLSTWKIADDHLKDSRLNGLFPAHDAVYNSRFSDKIERVGCFQNTRVSVLEGIRQWINGVNEAKIYWMNGMAGTGKTAIGYSVCTELKQNGRLGASFFCSRVSPNCRDMSRILPTIAYQLARSFYPFRSVLCRILGEESDISQCNILEQFEYLIRTPLLEVQEMLPNGLVIVIDALDECSDPKSTEIVLDALFRHAANLPVRFFLTSRPEPSISNIILARDSKSRSVLHLHNVEAYFVKADIQTYFTIKMAKLSLGEDQIKQLADLAGILFIYAATVARYILAARPGANTSARLAAVLAGDATKQGTKKDQEIDRLYETILGGALGDEQLEESEVELIKQVLWTVMCTREPVTKNTLAALLDVDGEQVSAALQPLLSVLHVSEGSEVVSALHASFPEFMFSLERSGRSLFCDEKLHNKYLTRRCFEVMEEQLRFNICNLETSHLLDKDIPNLQARVEKAISPELFYACRYWAEHLQSSATCNELLSCLNRFLHDQLLFWMEVLNLKGWVGNGPKVLAEVQNWLLNSKGEEVSETRQFIQDARSFVTVFAANPVCQSTPHIYLSVLPLVSRQSKVWETYWGQTQGLLWVDGSAMNQRGGSALATWEIESEVTTIACSPDGTRIASGSEDSMIRVWNAHSGAPLARPFRGHTSRVTSVAFSPSGTCIVSGSDDCTIRLWNAQNGAPLADPFKGHTEAVTSVAFSPDDTRIASGAKDHTIRVWDAYRGTSIVDPLMGHADQVTSVAFSPDGTRIVSGSEDSTIRTWNVHTGTPLAGPFECHTGRVVSVAFSPDGSCIVSGSEDQMIQVWDAHNGTSLAEHSLEGNTSWITSVAFSPDGTRIVSGTWDHTIHVWDARSNAPPIGPFRGHTSQVTSVAFSPDGTRVVSGSHDRTIRAWDVHSRAPLASPFEGHTEPVTAIAFSPDSTRIVSGSEDCTIRVWDAHGGTPLVHPLGDHKSWITSVAFSPDGTRIVSGSWDFTIQVWDAHSGIPLVGPFEGHTGRVTSVAFTPDGARIVSGSDDRTLRVWDAFSGIPIGSVFEGHTNYVMSVAVSPDGTRIVSGSYDCTIRVWDPRSASLSVEPLKGHTQAVTSVAFSPEGTRIVSGSEDLTLRVWDVQTGALLVGPFEGHNGWITSVAFSPDGTRLVSSSDDHTVREWDAYKGTSLALPYEGHTSRVTSVAFSPDGTHIASASNDHTIRVWEAFDRHHPQALIHDAWVIERNGWVLDSTRRSHLLWLPAELRDFFPRPPNTLIIRPEGSMGTSWRTVLLGTSWRHCYEPSPSAILF